MPYPLLNKLRIKKDETKGKEITPSGFTVDEKALAGLKLVGVAYSHVERDHFPTEDAYLGELEVIERAKQVIEKIESFGIKAKGYEADEYFLANLLVDKPDIVINLVDTFKGIGRLSTSVPAALELLDIEYTGAGMQGFVLGCNRQFTYEILEANNVPIPPYQFIKRSDAEIKTDLGLPLIIKLNDSGGSVGINNHAVQETIDDARQKVTEMLDTYKMPVIVERFIDGPEVTAIVYDDGSKKHIYLGEKKFNFKPDGKHEFTSFESYKVKDSYEYKKHNKYEDKLKKYVAIAFNCLRHKDYGKFDIRIDPKTEVPYITDSNPNTAFGPSMGLPIMEVSSLYEVKFEELLLSLLSKHARKINK